MPDALRPPKRRPPSRGSTTWFASPHNPIQPCLVNNSRGFGKPFSELQPPRAWSNKSARSSPVKPFQEGMAGPQACSLNQRSGACPRGTKKTFTHGPLATSLVYGPSLNPPMASSFGCLLTRPFCSIRWTGLTGCRWTVSCVLNRLKTPSQLSPVNEAVTSQRPFKHRC